MLQPQLRYTMNTISMEHFEQTRITIFIEFYRDKSNLQVKVSCATENNKKKI